MTGFKYQEAFSRNVGLISPEQQELLRQSRVAIAGLGGVGGDYLISLIRIGIENFKVADPDSFELANFNRQYGATVLSLEHSKAQTLKSRGLEINPNCRIEIFDSITPSTIDQFLKDCDLVIDGMDVFESDAHQLLIEESQRRGLTVLAAIPLGWTVAYVAFSKISMSFSAYFGFLNSQSPVEKVLRFTLGFAPKLLHLKHLNPENVDLEKRKGPSSVGSCKLCSGFITIQAIKALLDPASLKVAPWSFQYDGLDFKLKRSYLWLGARNIMFNLKLKLALSRFR